MKTNTSFLVVALLAFALNLQPAFAIGGPPKQPNGGIGGPPKISLVASIVATVRGWIGGPPR